jgi:hypothetical protein
MLYFLEQEHPNVLNDMRERIAGDAGDQWVHEALTERFAAYEEVRPAGYKFLGEFRRDGQSPAYRDLVVAYSDRKSAAAEARAHLSGADNIKTIALSRADLASMNLQEGQIRK